MAEPEPSKSWSSRQGVKEKTLPSAAPTIEKNECQVMKLFKDF